MKPFKKNDYPTLGVEEEFHLIDQHTGKLMPGVDAVMEGLDSEMKERVCYELLQCVIENRTGVYKTADELVTGVCHGRKKLSNRCLELGLLLVAGGSHPFGDWRKQPFVEDEHYRWVRDNYRYIAHRLLAFGLHIHVGVKSSNAAIYIMNQMRRWVYPLLALSANSPYYEGQETGLASTRTHLFTSMPRTGLAPAFHDFSELEKFYNRLLCSGDITRPGDLWWTIRPQPPLGTIEVRVFDLPTDVRCIGALAAITQAIVAKYQDDFYAGAPESKLHPHYLYQNRWRAMRDGLEAIIIEPETGDALPVREQLERLFELITPGIKVLRAEHHLNYARKMLKDGNEAQQQVARCRRLNRDLKMLEFEIAAKSITFFQ